MLNMNQMRSYCKIMVREIEGKLGLFKFKINKILNCNKQFSGTQ